MMRDLFPEACALVLRVEGGLVDDPRDPGGITNHGISLRFALSVGDLDRDGRPDLDVDGDGDTDADDIRALHPDDARDVYRKAFWEAARCPALPPAVAILLFDAAVNQGRGPAVTMLQDALGVTADGRIGPQTVAAALRANQPALLAEYAARRAHRYATTRNFDRFGLGWCRRLAHLHQTAAQRYL